MEKLKIIAIVGSLRKNSYNRQLAMWSAEFLREQADIEILDYTDVPFFNQDIEYPAPESVKRVREKIKAADGVWFFTPEYNHYFSGVMKNLIDWLSRPAAPKQGQVLSRKPAAISGVTMGMSGTGIAQDHLVTMISMLNMDVMNFPRLPIPNVMKQVDENDRLVLTESAEFAEHHAKSFIKFIEKRKKLAE